MIKPNVSLGHIKVLILSASFVWYAEKGAPYLNKSEPLLVFTLSTLSRFRRSVLELSCYDHWAV